MLIIAGTLEIDPAQRDAFIAAGEEGMRAARAEAGCLDYVLSADPLEPGRVYLFERWESKEHLAPHLERIRAPQPPSDISPIVPLAADLQQYEINGMGPIGS